MERPVLTARSSSAAFDSARSFYLNQARDARHVTLGAWLLQDLRILLSRYGIDSWFMTKVLGAPQSARFPRFADLATCIAVPSAVLELKELAVEKRYVATLATYHLTSSSIPFAPDVEFIGARDDIVVKKDMVCMSHFAIMVASAMWEKDRLKDGRLAGIRSAHVYFFAALVLPRNRFHIGHLEVIGNMSSILHTVDYKTGYAWALANMRLRSADIWMDNAHDNHELLFALSDGIELARGYVQFANYVNKDSRMTYLRRALLTYEGSDDPYAKDSACIVKSMIADEYALNGEERRAIRLIEEVLHSYATVDVHPHKIQALVVAARAYTLLATKASVRREFEHLKAQAVEYWERYDLATTQAGFDYRNDGASDRKQLAEADARWRQQDSVATAVATTFLDATHNDWMKRPKGGNCYAYALNYISDRNYADVFRAFPGIRHRREQRQLENYQELIQDIVKDGIVDGVSHITLVGTGSQFNEASCTIKKNQYLIVFLIAEKHNDFHFCRRHPATNCWWHKLGEKDVENLGSDFRDAQGRLIVQGSTVISGSNTSSLTSDTRSTSARVSSASDSEHGISENPALNEVVYKDRVYLPQAWFLVDIRRNGIPLEDCDYGITISSSSS